VDFAPVADLHREDSALGDRSASPDPLEAALAAGAFLEGLEGASVQGCLKHFPGLGGLVLDTHLALPDREDPGELERGLLPFRALAHPERLVMVAHLRLPHSGGLPASLCPGAVKANPWGVRARFLPDDLEMGGCQDWDWDQRTRLCLEAGHMALLVCQTPQAVNACAEAAGRLEASLWRPAVQAFRAFRRRLPRGPRTFQGEAWKALVVEIQRETQAFLD
jgi:beta-N-acetylhexosaminidase